MGRQYCFLGTFQQTIGFLDTHRGRTIGFLSEKGDADVCSIVVTLQKIQGLSPFLITIDTRN